MNPAKDYGYVLFSENGQFTEHPKNVPEPQALTDYLLWRAVSGQYWYSSEIRIGSNDIEWRRCDEDSVPPPLRALALIMF